MSDLADLAVRAAPGVLKIAVTDRGRAFNGARYKVKVKVDSPTAGSDTVYGDTIEEAIASVAADPSFHTRL